MTKEHVWPKWLRKYIELGDGPAIGHSRTRGRKGKTVSRESWTSKPIDWQVKGPCKPCNEGWMEQLESQVRPILVPMLEDRRVVLERHQQEVLAKWATLRLMMGQLGHPADVRAIGPASYERFHVSRAVPVGAQIWSGRYGGAGAWPTNYQHVALYYSAPPAVPEPAHPNGWVVAFHVGYAAFLYSGHEIANGPVDAG